MRQKKGAWTVTASRSVYRNPWIEVREDEVVQPDGEEGVFGVVEMKPGVSVLPVDAEGNAYLLREYRYTLDRETIEVIAGGIDGDEPAREAARRELREEGGITAEEWIDLGVIDQLTEVVVAPSHLFLARGLSFAPPDREGTESIKPIKVPFDEAVAWVMENKITHAASVALILKAKHWLASAGPMIEAW